jgi:DNA gyrase/topoisomerase IV subunit B
VLDENYIIKWQSYERRNQEATIIQQISVGIVEGMGVHVRMRPSMYIGDVGVHGLHHLVYVK